MLDRTVAPAFQKTVELALPNPVVAGGESYPIFYLAGLRQNIVKIEVVFTGGKGAETQTGLSHFTSMMLEKGTDRHTSNQIAEHLDRFGASLEISPGFDSVSVSLYALKAKLREVFPIWLELMTSPAFPEKEWVLMAEIFKQNLKVNNEKTSYVASKMIRKNVFGADHPYGASVEDDDVNAILPASLSAFFKASFLAESAWILGELGDGDLAYVTDGLKVLKAGAPVLNSPGSGINVAYPWQTEKDGRSQSSLRLGKRGILRSHPDYTDLLLTTHILGGFFGSRLMKNIREEKGLTYGISASLNAFRDDSLFVIGADVNKENAELALREIRSELVMLGTELVGAEELSLARNHFIGSLQTDMANLFSVEEKLKSIHLNGLRHEFYQDMLIRMDQITAEQVRATAGRYLNPDSFFEVVVG